MNLLKSEIRKLKKEKKKKKIPKSEMVEHI
jgi:uncharacterized small protein (DUF1192 family)